MPPVFVTVTFASVVTVDLIHITIYTTINRYSRHYPKWQTSRTFLIPDGHIDENKPIRDFCSFLFVSWITHVSCESCSSSMWAISQHANITSQFNVVVTNLHFCHFTLDIQRGKQYQNHDYQHHGNRYWQSFLCSHFRSNGHFTAAVTFFKLSLRA